MLSFMFPLSQIKGVLCIIVALHHHPVTLLQFKHKHTHTFVALAHQLHYVNRHSNRSTIKLEHGISGTCIMFCGVPKWHKTQTHHNIICGTSQSVRQLHSSATTHTFFSGFLSLICCSCLFTSVL